MKIHRLMAVAIALAAPVALLAQVPQTRVVQTNQIPENPAKIIEIVGAPEPERDVVAAPIDDRDDIVVRRNRNVIGVDTVGAPVPPRERPSLEEPEREVVRKAGHKEHR